MNAHARMAAPRTAWTYRISFSLPVPRGAVHCRIGRLDLAAVRRGPTRPGAVCEIAGYGPDVLVEEPTELVDAVVRRFTGVVSAQGGAA